MYNKHIVRLREITIEPTPDLSGPPQEIPRPLNTVERVWAEVRPNIIRAAIILCVVYAIVGLFALTVSPGVKQRAAERAAAAGMQGAADALDRAVEDMDRRIADGVRGSKKYAAQGTAAALSVPTVTFASSEDTKAVGVNLAHYGGEMALGVAGAVKLTPSLAFQAGFASPLAKGGSVAVRAGLSYSWR